MELSLENLTQLIDRLHRDNRENDSGKLADYIPQLGKAEPSKFAISITTTDGKTVSVGDSDIEFSIQSISKPFVFGQALEKHGLEKVRSRVGVEPTGEPFHSMIRLDNQSKKPYNPLVNTGAIAMTNLVREEALGSEKLLSKMFTNYSGRELTIDRAVYESEKNTGHRNRAIAYLMLHFGMVEPEVEATLDLYFKQCSFRVTSVDLSVMAATLANLGTNPKTGVAAISTKYVKHLLTLMFTCGLYTYAGDWAFDVGVPAKSGVSGGILAVVPGKMGIGVYSPLVDEHGNSVRGLKTCEALSEQLKLHVFDEKF